MTTKFAYIQISPRGFRNETTVYRGTVEQVEAALDVINNHRNAWARRISGNHTYARSARYRASLRGETVPELCEDVVRPFRQVWLFADGTRGVKGPEI